MTATLTTLVSFISNSFGGGPNGTKPEGELIADSNGDLFGTTSQGGANGGPVGDGTVFEIAKTAAGYASTPTTLVSFNGADGAGPLGGLIADANGDLFGTTSGGGGNLAGTVFEIAKTATGYATAPTTLVSFDGFRPLPQDLIADADGDLFGTTEEGGGIDLGSAFEIKKTAAGYASTPTTLVNFNIAVGAGPLGSLIADGNGDLFGTTSGGGANRDGTVFEVKKTAGGYANTPTTLVSFNGADGAGPLGGLIADANGDLFGTTSGRGTQIFNSTVFEIKKTAAGYATAPTTLVDFDFTLPGSLIADAHGDLFGATLDGGANSAGTVFEIKKTAAGYATAPTTLVDFNGLTATGSIAGLLADATGDLFGTTSGGTSGAGTVFEVTDSGFVTTPPNLLANFSWAQGWGSANNPREVVSTTTNPGGGADYIGFGSSSVIMAFGESTANGPTFANAIAAIHNFGSAEGYTASVQRGAADTGDSIAPTVYGQGFKGVYWYDATGGTGANPTYQSTPNLYPNFGSQQGWSPANGFDVVKADSTDAFASILGFGNADIVVGPQAFNPSTAGSPTAPYTIPFAAGNNSGWSQTTDIRSFLDSNGQAIDLNGDGITDFVGMGPQGLEFAFGSDTGGHYSLGPLQLAQISGTKSNFGDAQGWNDSNTTRVIKKDSTSGFDDIIAFGAAGVYVSMGQDPATHNGQPFGQAYLALNNFGSNQGWSNTLTPRLVGDVSGDGIPDIVGFGANSTFTALGSHDPSTGHLIFTMDPTATIANYGYNEGWSTSNTIRTLADVDGSGADSLVVSGAANTQVLKLG